MNREKVYSVIDGERDYQDEQAAKWDHKGIPSVAAELLMMEEYMAKARTMWVNSTNDQAALDMLRKVVGIGVRCFENHSVPSRQPN